MNNLDLITKAILRGDSTIVIDSNTIDLPTRQNAGTEAQKYWHSRQLATKIVNNL